MRFDQLPEGAQAALAPWVNQEDVQTVLLLDPSLAAVIEGHGRVAFERGRNYSLTVAFPIGDKWQVSADVQMGSAEDVLLYLSRRASQ